MACSIQFSKKDNWLFGDNNRTSALAEVNQGPGRVVREGFLEEVPFKLRPNGDVSAPGPVQSCLP